MSHEIKQIVEQGKILERDCRKTSPRKDKVLKTNTKLMLTPIS
jgi:hypothetical protein